jgi:hypothetical protein
MKRTPIFISFRKKRHVPEGPLTAESQDYELKHAHEILIDDDLESHQSFGEDFFVAPKGEVFESKHISAFLNVIFTSSQSFTATTVLNR